MTIFIKILSFIGYILLFILALILWIILMPRHFYIEYSKKDGPILKVNILFFKFTLYPIPKFIKKILKIEDEDVDVENDENNEIIQGSFESNKNSEVSSRKDMQKHILLKNEVYSDKTSNVEIKKIANENQSETDNNLKQYNVEDNSYKKTSDHTNTSVVENTKKSASESFKSTVEKVKNAKDERKKTAEESKNKIKDKYDSVIELKEKIAPNGNFDEFFSIIKEILSTAKGTIKRVIWSIKFRDVSFTLPIYDEDPLALQKKYAAITTAFYSISMFLQKHLQFYYKSPIFVPDYSNQYSESVYFYCKITASPIHLLLAAIYCFKQYRKIKKDYIKTSTEKEK